MTGRLKSKNYTERALAGATIPSFCYVPRGLRPGEGRLNIAITNSEIIDNHKRIAEADPLGWMIAVSNGQPIPHFEVRSGELVLTYAVPSMEERFRATEWLASRVTFKAPSAYNNTNPGKMRQHSSDYDTLIKQRGSDAQD